MSGERAIRSRVKLSFLRMIQMESPEDMNSGGIKRRINELASKRYYDNGIALSQLISAAASSDAVGEEIRNALAGDRRPLQGLARAEVSVYIRDEAARLDVESASSYIFGIVRQIKSGVLVVGPPSFQSKPDKH